MKRLALGWLVLALAAPPSVQAQGAGLTGLWQVKDTRIELRFQPCGGEVCGVIETSKRIQDDPDARDVKNKDPALRTRRLKGVAMLVGLKPTGPAWKGRVYLAGSGETYGVTVKSVGADTLAATGCAAPFICQTQTLVRKR